MGAATTQPISVQVYIYTCYIQYIYMYCYASCTVHVYTCIVIIASCCDYIHVNERCRRKEEARSSYM